MEAKISLTLTPLEFNCIRLSLNSSAAGIYHEYRDNDCKTMNEYQETVLSLSDKFNSFSSE